MTGVIAAIVNAIVPYVAKMFASNIFETYTGIPAGELFSQGAAAANFSLATQSSAYMPASEETVKDQNRHTTRALAQEAEIDRLQRSPSVRSLIPAASALDDDLKYTSNYSKCNNLAGTVCDMYGYPIPASDYSTVDIKPDDSTFQSVIQPNLDENGDIKDNSELAKFVNFCMNRESPWGVMDANILNALQTDGGIVVNNLPIVNDIIDVINAVEDTANQSWATGENCVNSPSNPRWDSEFKYYQRYVEDMRILHGMDDPEDSETNPVLAYQERYEEKHPIDNSFKGTLSRISGLSMDDVAFLLEYVDYSTEIANYDPSTRDKFGDYVEPEVKLSFSEDKTPSFNILPIISDSIFVDKRNYTV